MGMKVCKNGHKYDDSLRECPFCPKAKDGGLKATVVDDGASMPVGAVNRASPKGDAAKTRIVSGSGSPAKTAAAKGGNDLRRTRIAGPPAEGKRAGAVSLGADASKSPYKLVGWLVTFTWNDKGDDYRIREGKTKIGSKHGLDITLGDGLVSGEHAVLLYKGGVLKIKDSFSSNGTKVNDEDIQDEPRILKDGDRIMIGSTLFKLRLIEDGEVQS